VKRYTVAQVRERLAAALDEAEQGVPVFIERKGVRYRLSLDTPKTAGRSRGRSRIETLDPAIEQGAWTWNWTGEGMRFRRRPAK
jgi:antitoxin (DNA-binding transcriptional repressor) of toxin-antitoxin stability system